MIIEPEARAARYLREWLLWKLPAACVAVNLLRAATLLAPGPGPYTIPSGAKLKLSLTGKSSTEMTEVTLTSGSRTTAQLVTEINTAMGASVASADTEDRLLLTSTTPPSFVAVTLVATDSIIAVGYDETGANDALGFESGGQHMTTTPVTPPAPDGVCDGFPSGGFFVPGAIGKGRIAVTIGERVSNPTDRSPRRAETDIILDLGIFRSEPSGAVHQSREGIQAALRCVRACLTTDAGKQLGKPNEVMLALEQSARISPWAFQQQQAGDSPGGPLFDAASMKLGVRVFQQPDIT
jgi:hypothetical protein